MTPPRFCRRAVMAGSADKDDVVCVTYTNTPTSVADPDPDPDPPNPRGFGPPGSGIQILFSLSRNSKKTLDFYCFVTSV
jgi:hypothetical protein